MSVDNCEQRSSYVDYRNKYLNAPNLNLTAPVDVSLELSSFCNMGCTYCYHSDKKQLPFKQNFMEALTAHRIIFEAAYLGVNSLKFNWRGEATMNPAFASITAYAKRLATGSTFIDRITNSNFKFSPDKSEIFEGLANQTKVKVSYDSFRKEVFEKQRALGDHDVTTKNIDRFYNWPGRKTVLVIQAVRTRLNRDEDIAGEARKRWPDALISIRDMVEGRVGKDLSAVKDKERDYSERQSCIQAHARLIFDWQGNAVPCCPDIKAELSLGNIQKMSLLDIFNSPKAKALRQDLLSLKAFESSPCKDCSSFETFKGFAPNFDS